jgi:DNA-binding NtrC family response regulator
LRIIAATHRDFKAEVANGKFRLDLYYRLNVFPIRLPPLRERKEDIPQLIDYFLLSARESGSLDFHPSPETLATLSAHDFPGNVRELKHCIDRMAVMASSGAAHDALPSPLDQARGASTIEHGDGEAPHAEFRLRPPAARVISIPESERQAIVNALAATHGERGRAAAMLGIGRTTLYRKMKEYGLD